MKPIHRLIVIVAALAFATAAHAAKIVVTAAEADAHSDVTLTSMTAEDSLEVVLDEFRRHLTTAAKRYLKDGQTMEVNFSDIDLAGEFEPWHSRGYQDVRWVRDIYVPRLKFDYKLTDAEGGVISEGSENLVDLAFLWSVSQIDSHTQTRYEKQMLTDWMRKFRAKG